MTRSLAALAAVLAATAAGCGAANQPAQDFSGAEEDVAQVVEEFQSAAQKDEPTRVCNEILSTALSRRLGKNCTGTVATALQDADIFEVGADSVRITGDRARVRIDAGNDGTRQELLEMVKQQRGGWRIDRFGGVVE